VESENEQENETEQEHEREQDKDGEQMEDETEIRGKKRSQGDDHEVLNDSFRKNFPPLKTRRPSQVPRSFETINPFSVLGLDLEDPPLVIDKSGAGHVELRGTGVASRV
jgi:hypothetical protein